MNQGDPSVEKLRELARTWQAASGNRTDSECALELESMIPELVADRDRLLETFEKLADSLEHEREQAVDVSIEKLEAWYNRYFNTGVEQPCLAHCVRCRLEAAIRAAKGGERLMLRPYNKQQYEALRDREQGTEVEIRLLDTVTALEAEIAALRAEKCTHPAYCRDEMLWRKEIQLERAAFARKAAELVELHFEHPEQAIADCAGFIQHDILALAQSDLPALDAYVAKRVRESELPFGLVNIIAAADEGLKKWASQPHNKKWWKRIDGTPIPNDLLVNVTQAIWEMAKSAQAATRTPLGEGRERRRAMSDFTSGCIFGSFITNFVWFLIRLRAARPASGEEGSK